MVFFRRCLFSLAEHSSTGTKLLAASAVSTTCLWSVETVASDLLSRNDVSIYRSAIAASERGLWKLAHRTAANAKAPLPAKILLWMDMTRRGTDITFGQISRFISANPKWPLQRSLQRNAERAMTAQVAPAEVLNWFLQHPPLTTEGKLRKIGALFASGEVADARALIRQTWITGSFGRKQARQFRRQYQRYLTKDDHEARLDQLLWLGRVSQARRTMRLVSQDKQKLAAARISLRTFRGGVDWHIRQVPKALLGDPGFVYERVRWRRRKGYDDDAFDLLKDVPVSSQHPEKWWVERSILARRLLEKGHITDAYHLASKNGLTAGARYVEVEWLCGWIALRFLDDPKLAVKHFQRIRKTVKYPISIARAEYWIGRSMEKTKAFRQAALSFAAGSKHGTTYYGQLAAARSGQAATLAKTKIRPSPSDIKSFENDERVRAIRILNQLRETGSIKYFASALINQSDNTARLILIARLAEEIGRSDLAVRAGRRSYRIAKPLPDIAYPVIGVPNGRPEKALLHALIRQESNFERQAISPAGARGLMQLIPVTARSVAKKINIRYSRNRLTRDRSYNIRLGRS